MGKVLAVILALVMGLAVPARAAETGSIQVVVRYGGEPVGWGQVTLYRVGEECPEGYRILEALGGGHVSHADALSPYLAQWLVEMGVVDGMVRELDENSIAAYEDLERGLYLLTQTAAEEGAANVLPMMITLPCQGQWEVTSYPATQKLLEENPKTGQHPAPLLGAAGMVLSGIGLAVCVGRRRRLRNS